LRWSESGSAPIEKVAEQFRLLGEPMRLKILQALCVRPLAVGEIVETTGATQSNISKTPFADGIGRSHQAPKGWPMRLLQYGQTR